MVENATARVFADYIINETDWEATHRVGCCHNKGKADGVEGSVFSRKCLGSILD